MLKEMLRKYKELRMVADVMVLAGTNVSVDFLITSEEDDKFSDTMDNLLRDRRGEIRFDDNDYYFIRGTRKDFNKILKAIRNYLYKHESEETRIDFIMCRNGTIEVFIYDADDILKFRENTLKNTFGEDR